MTNKELQELLKQYPDDEPVFMTTMGCTTFFHIKETIEGVGFCLIYCEEMDND